MWPRRARRRSRELDRRRAQAWQLCAQGQDFQVMADAAMDACCPATGGHHRRSLQASCSLPVTCPSAACAAVFVPFMADGEYTLSTVPGLPIDQYHSFAASCSELQTGSQLMLQDARPAMIFHVLVIDEGAAQAGGMFPGGAATGSGDQPLDPLQPLSPPPPTPPSPPVSGAATAQEFHRICTKTNLATCAPTCDELTYGYLLSIEIGGRGTVMTCNKVDGIFSWQGQASLGGYIGADSVSFFSAVTSGAAGTYMGTLTADVGISTFLTIRAGQMVDITGDPGLAVAPSWGGGFAVHQFGSLSLTNLVVSGSISVDVGAMLLLMNVARPSGTSVAYSPSADRTVWIHQCCSSCGGDNGGHGGQCRNGGDPNCGPHYSQGLGDFTTGAPCDPMFACVSAC